MSTRQPRPAKPVAKVLQLTITYRVEVENFNAEDVLDKLREMGAAEIANVEVVEGPV